jgi:hypothetical protein
MKMFLSSVLSMTVGVLASLGQTPGSSKSVSLDVVESAGNSATLQNYRSSFSGYTNKTKSASRELAVSIRNMSGTLPGEFNVEWYFIGKRTGGTRRFLYDKGTKQLSMKPSEIAKFSIESKELVSTRAYSYYSGYTYSSGDKADGWIVRIKSGSEIVRVKTSNPQLEEFQKDAAAFEKFINAGDPAKPAPRIPATEQPPLNGGFLRP